MLVAGVPITFRTQVLTCLVAHHVEGFCEVAPTGPKVIGLNTKNFGPVFEFLLLKIVGGSPSQVGCALTTLGYLTHENLRGQQLLGAEIWSS